ncbi:VOC family protein [Siccibacter turicensis]
MSDNPVRGMDHIGITVADIEAATQFFIDAFGAKVLYDSLPLAGEDNEGTHNEQVLNLAPGTVVKAVRMLWLRHGPGIELFQMQGPTQREPVRPSDYGLQHFAVYVEDMPEAVTRFERAGGKMFTEPQPLTFAPEKGEGNCFCYGRTPWGSVIELISTPSPLPYTQHTSLRRWKP